jgi:hypothetical protein
MVTKTLPNPLEAAPKRLPSLVPAFGSVLDDNDDDDTQSHHDRDHTWRLRETERAMRLARSTTHASTSIRTSVDRKCSIDFIITMS